MSSKLFTAIDLNIVCKYGDADIVEAEYPHLSLIRKYNNTLANNTNGGYGNHEIKNLFVKKANASVSGTLLDVNSFTNVFGKTVSLKYIRFVAIFNNSTTVGQNIYFGGAFASIVSWFSGTSVRDVIPPGGFNIKYNPSGILFEVIPTEAIEVFVGSSSSTPEYELYIGGV